MSKGWRTLFGLLTLLIWSPAIMLLLSMVTATALDCPLHEGFTQPCPLLGQEIGGLLYAGFVMGWLLVVTAPLMLGTLVGWLILLWRR